MTPERFLPLADAFAEALLLLSSDGKVIAANKVAGEFLQTESEWLSRRSLHDLVTNEPDKLAALLRSWSRSRTPIPAPLVWKNRTLWKGHSRCHGYLFDPEAGENEGRILLRCSKGRPQTSEFVALNQVIRKQNQTLKMLQESRDEVVKEHEKAMVTLHSIGDAVITTDAEGKVEYLNPVAEALTGWTTGEACGQPLSDVFNITNELSGASAPNPVERVLQEGRVVELADHTALVSRDGTKYIIEDSAAPIRLPNGQVLGTVLVFRDTTGEGLARRQLEYLAQHDTLTGLYNRYYFEQQLKHAIVEASLGKSSYALFYIDLDQFKTINDTAGHGAGDELLVAVAEIFARRTRRGDILARLGGDEFGVLLEQCAEGQVKQAADSFVESLDDFRFEWEGRTYDITPSVGVSMIDLSTASPAEALRQADIACYVAKQGGRNRSHVYRLSDDQDLSPVGEMNLINDIRAAIAEDRFVLHFQPVINARENTVTMYEALLRMEAVDGTLISPGAFIPVAERYGLMPQVDLWVLNKILNILVSDEFLQSNLYLSINLSGSSVGSEDVLSQICESIQSRKIHADRMILEITETAAVGNIQRAGEFMRQLRKAGCRFALDDFGTGFSSFAYLKHLPVDYIKIDGTFVRDILDDPIDQAMVRSIIHIAHSLGKQTIAEYVEDEAIFRHMNELGVDFVQGFYTGSPKPQLPF